MSYRKNTGRELFGLFVRRELKSLMGRRNVNVWFLTLMLVLTFLAITFTDGSRRMLEFKMDDPYVRSAEMILKSGFDKDVVTRALKEINSDSALYRDYYFKNTCEYHRITCFS